MSPPDVARSDAVSLVTALLGLERELTTEIAVNMRYPAMTAMHLAKFVADLVARLDCERADQLDQPRDAVDMWQVWLLREEGA